MTATSPRRTKARTALTFHVVKLTRSGNLVERFFTRPAEGVRQKERVGAGGGKGKGVSRRMHTRNPTVHAGCFPITIHVLLIVIILQITYARSISISPPCKTKHFW